MTESPSAGGHQSGELGGSRGVGEATPDFGVAESELEVGPPCFRVLPAEALIPAVAGVLRSRRGGEAPPYLLFHGCS